MPSSSAHRRRLMAALAALSTLTALGCSGGPSPRDPGAAPPAAAEAPSEPSAEPSAEVPGEEPGAADPAAVPIADVLPPEPPDGKWLTDEEGRQYFVQVIPKYANAWRWVEEGKRVQTVRGMIWDIVGHDEDSFAVKIYRPVADRRPPPLPRQVETAEVELASVERLRLEPFHRGLPDQGQWRHGFDLADMNGDGHLDIVHGPPRKSPGPPRIFLGDGRGGWRPWREARFPAVPFDYGDVAAADFDGDGAMDLAVASHLRGVVAMLGDGKGGFRRWSDGIPFYPDPAQAGPDAFSSRAMEVADWDGDGRPDLLVLGEGPTLAIAGPTAAGGDFQQGGRGTVIYLNEGDGSWRRIDEGAAEAAAFGDSLAVADFNGDGRLDFATASASQGAKNLVKLGGREGGWETLDLLVLADRAVFPAVAAADFDGGPAELLVGYVQVAGEMDFRTGLDLLRARPDGTWERRPLAAEVGNFGVWAVDAGDLDGDGLADIVALSGDGRVWIFLGEAGGGFVRNTLEQPLAATRRGCRGYHVRLADLDGDGRDEIVAAFAGEPSGLPGLLEQPACQGQGTLRAWKGVEIGP